MKRITSAFDLPRSDDDEHIGWGGESIATLPTLVLVDERPSVTLSATRRLGWDMIPDPTPATIAAYEPVGYTSVLPIYTPETRQDRRRRVRVPILLLAAYLPAAVLYAAFLLMVGPF